MLPTLRDDLQIERGAPLLSGAPAWVIYDPVRHRYFQVGQRMIEILRAWGMGNVARLRAYTAREFGWQPDGDELAAVVQFLTGAELTKLPPGGSSRSYSTTAEKARKIGPLALAKSYLFFRIPLVRPQRFLDATVWLARPILSRGMVWCLLVIAVIGLSLAARQLDAFLAYAERFLSLDGALYYAVALIGIKLCHEMGHAWQATLRGVRVPVMGLAFMVMFPLLYTDVSDAWRLRNRRDRLMIDAGGVMVELGIAAIATLLWVILPDGPMRGVAFAAATTSWVLSLAVNLNPFMRFDGYYFLADAIGVQNLQPRAFALTRWRVRKALFGLNDPAPESFTPRMRRFLIGYSIVTWAYRVLLYLGIALLVYNLFFKAAGIFLLIVELSFFLALPILREMRIWFKMRQELITHPRFWLVLGIMGLGCAALFVPYPTTVRIPAIMGVTHETGLYPQHPGQITQIQVQEGQTVTAGTPLITLQAPALTMELKAARRRAKLAQLRFDRRGASMQDRAQGLILEGELQAARKQIIGLEAAQDQLTLLAPFDAVVMDLDNAARPGLWVSDHARLATLIAPDLSQLSGYVAEKDVARIGVDATGRFIPDDPDLPTQTARLTTISDFTAQSLGRGYLSAANGGPIPVENNPDTQAETPFGAWFSVTAVITREPEFNPVPMRVQRGILLVSGRSESIFFKTYQQIARVLLREFDL
ncbi:hypothetical protein BFP70_03375 [Thioclava sp. SK-1]|nr:hypothetical protein BFP70_03375 [Thioclava sp. SK-1]